MASHTKARGTRHAVDDAFDAVISVPVLEQVRDPFTAAKEITRVLKPGGKLFCCVRFLQPFHGYPNHYYNMTHVGLASLFGGLKV
ncbi:MAG TPA: methyltransferase domain-containing protein, partial [Isosphaeraceae bacterium]|nr:methyltransferase domain-containing protein [Isosphaeraceae bacterium]